MSFIGEVKVYSSSRLRGYIALEGYEDILFYIKDVPFNYIEPKLGEKFQFEVFQHDGKVIAKQIQRLDLVVEQNWKQRLIALGSKYWLHYKSQTIAMQRKILLLIIVLCCCLLAVVVMALHQWHQQYQAEKARALMLQQQQMILQQREALGDLPDVVLSEQGQRNLDGNVYGDVRDRSEMTTMKIDRLNGQLPVSSGKFKCDGRVYCAEMRSYAEAVYFHRHCKATQLDNNGNGKPCENDTRWSK